MIGVSIRARLSKATHHLRCLFCAEEENDDEEDGEHVLYLLKIKIRIHLLSKMYFLHAELTACEYGGQHACVGETDL